MAAPHVQGLEPGLAGCYPPFTHRQQADLHWAGQADRADWISASAGGAVKRLLLFLVLMAVAVSPVMSCALSRGVDGCVVNLFLLPGKRAHNALKNRTTLPTAADFDAAVNLDALLAPGDDRRRWSPMRAARVEGIVVRVHDADAESANCFSLSRLDAHIEVARRADAPPSERLIVEVTPPMRAWAATQQIDWSTSTLQRELTGRGVRFEGWLLFDDEHDEESENTRPGDDDNWRATAWELHPVTAIQVLADRAASYHSWSKRSRRVAPDIFNPMRVGDTFAHHEWSSISTTTITPRNISMR